MTTTGTTRTTIKKSNNDYLLIYYVGVLDPNTGKLIDNISEYMKIVVEKIGIVKNNYDVIFIPVLTYDTRIECINPQYITKKKLRKKHEKLMNELNTQLNYQIKKLKEENGK